MLLPHCMLLHRLSGLQTCGRECLGAHPPLSPGLTMGASPGFDDSVSASSSTGRGLTYHASAGPLAHRSSSCFDDINREANVRANENVTNGHVNVHASGWVSP